jgi:hypothetical protein
MFSDAILVTCHSKNIIQLRGSHEISTMQPQIKNHDNANYDNHSIACCYYLIAYKTFTSLLIRHRISAALHAKFILSKIS